MATPEHVIEKRKASALFQDTELGLAGRMLFGLEGRTGHSIAKKILGGSWITGTVYLTRQALEFHPDFLDAKLHKDADALRMTVPLEAISATEVHQGLATQILDVTAEGTTLSFRCYRANAFVTATQAACARRLA